MGLEIERKYLLEKFPQDRISQGQFKVLARQSFEQTYLALTDYQELRVRKIVEEKEGQCTKSFVHTFKEGQGIARKEIEYEISEELYDQLIEGKKPLKKVRTTVVEEGMVYEIDEYSGFDMMTIEVEFKTEEEAKSFSAPEWFGEEVGSEKEYRNKTLWASLQKEDHYIALKKTDILNEVQKSRGVDSPAFSNVLAQLAHTFSTSGVVWGVGGSTLLAQYNLVKQPRDLDIIVQQEDTAQAELLLTREGERRALESRAPFLTNRFYQIVMKQAEIDVMCGLRIEHDEGIFDYTFNQSTIAYHKEIQGQLVPYSYLEDWYVLYSLMPGKEQRVHVIEMYWAKHGMEHPDRIQAFLNEEVNLPQRLKEKLLVLKEQYKSYTEN
ncbi:CYTH domain-containing protein [Bacillus horti]|uniref:CYTH domain-containing protein n=1 Tax=Caldalkalibacillus horti TaxID=77523 RepID=A0ABT9VWA8_9BACI|nr:CYTH domain-containing protein [Bacillus horti]MDQ0165280.1 CYTH domain-containing protein [Bacillus horti]